MVARSAQEMLETASVAITPQRALLESLREINLRFLAAVLNAAQSPNYANAPALGDLTPVFQSLHWDSAARAARFPFLLMDLGLSEATPDCNVPALLRQHSRVRDRESPESSTPSSHLAVAQAALVLAWHTARTDLEACLVLFGLAPSITADIATLALHELELMAPYCAMMLRPRWRESPLLWQELLSPTGHKSVESVRGFVMHAFQLTARSHLISSAIRSNQTVRR
ncbi:MAG: hypothetical protein IT480_18910 [Gammaproteobacteria bacterium]|nr:hypothetical protein [Gammaproteobacteria bacterium]